MPTKSSRKPARIDDQLRDAIKTSGFTAYRLTEETGVAGPMISRFLRKERTLRLDSAAKLAAFLGLELGRFPTGRQSREKEQAG
jgi:transcriptional regulator with XRE-family HTH domain